MRIFSSLQRKTTSTNFIPQIDGLRFFAIITVVLYHLNTTVSKESGIGLDKSFELMGGRNHIFNLGWWWIRFDLGVKLFFSISGFILSIPFLKFFLGLTDKKIAIKDYFIRRLVRLEPPFIISLLIFTFIQIVILNKYNFDLLKHLGAGLIYLHVLFFGQPNPINPVTWSLETEAQFYFFVPILFLFLFYWKKNWALFFLLILMFLSAMFRNHFSFHPHFSSSLFSFFINFGVGILFAWVYLTKFTWIQQKDKVYDIVGILSLIGLFLFYKPQHDLKNIFVFNLAMFWFLISSFKSYFFSWSFSRKIIYTIGGMCYSIYLLHYAFFHLSVKLSMFLWNNNWCYFVNLLFQILINLPIVLIVSSVYYVLFERPFMDRHFVLSLYNKLKNRKWY